MDSLPTSSMQHISYWEFFQQYYKPLLQDLDILLKCMETTISVDETAQALALTKETVESIMTAEKIDHIDQKGFWSIVLQGNSQLCGLLQREYLCGSPTLYSPEHIAYIHSLQLEHITQIFEANGYTEVPAQNLGDVLSQIYVFIMQ